MKEREDDILKALFQKEFETRRETVEEENWDFIAANLDKKRFYKFSYSRFNIFYLSTLILSLIISLFTLTYWINKTVFIENQESTNTVIPNAIFTDSITDNNINETTPSQSNASLKRLSSQSVSADSVFDHSIITKDNKPDSIYSTNLSPATVQDTSLITVPKEKPKTVIRKTVYKIKQDTLIKVDTVRTPSKKKNK